MTSEVGGRVLEHRVDRDCHKIALGLADGLKVETAFHHPGWLCVSSQAGCALACGFCETGARGFQRNLAVEEILAQRDLALRLSAPGPAADFGTISFSGMGEPLLNFDALAEVMRRWHRTSTSTLHVSTLGIMPRLPDLFALDVPFALDVSLHATTDEVRTRLMPINARYPIAPLLDAVFELNARRRALITLCYLLLEGVNDSDEDLRRLVDLMRGRDAYLELKRYNQTSTPGYRPSPPERFVEFVLALKAAGVRAYVFGNEGLAIGAGCGQLVWSLEHPAPVSA